MSKKLFVINDTNTTQGRLNQMPKIPLLCI